MKFLHQDKTQRSRRQELRCNATPQEKVLWKHLRRSGLGSKFERQHSIGPYVVDFYCPKKKLIIEIDGSQHMYNQEYDRERSLHFEHIGYKILRFWNREIDAELTEVIKKIKYNL